MNADRSFRQYDSSRKFVYHIIYELQKINEQNTIIHIYLVGILPDNEFKDMENWTKCGTFEEIEPWIEKTFFNTDYMYFGKIIMDNKNATLFEEKKGESYVLKINHDFHL